MIVDPHIHQPVHISELIFYISSECEKDSCPSWVYVFIYTPVLRFSPRVHILDAGGSTTALHIGGIRVLQSTHAAGFSKSLV